MSKAMALRLMRAKAKELEFAAPEFAQILDALADKYEDMPEETAHRDKVYTQIHHDSPITYPAWKCDNCGFEDRWRKGTHCRMCGRRFDD